MVLRLLKNVEALANYNAKNVGEQEVPFKPGRVVLQDFTGVPAVVDLAALRSAMQRGVMSKRSTHLSHVTLSSTIRCRLITLAATMARFKRCG